MLLYSYYRPAHLTCSHDYIADLHAGTHGKKFKSFRDWAGPKYGLFMEMIIDYANYVKAQRNEDPEQQDDTVSAPVIFEAGPGDLPLLPPPVHGVRSVETAKHAKEVIRAYFLRHYSKSSWGTHPIHDLNCMQELATGCESARTPWVTMGEDPGKFFDTACLPEGFRVQDPSRMGMAVKSLLAHLCQRQDELGVKAFSFHHVLRNTELEVAEYPDCARAALESQSPKTTQKLELDEAMIPSQNSMAAIPTPIVSHENEVAIHESPTKAIDPPPSTTLPRITFPPGGPQPAAASSSASVIPKAFPPQINQGDPRYSFTFQPYMSQMASMAASGWVPQGLPMPQYGLQFGEQMGIQPPEVQDGFQLPELHHGFQSMGSQHGYPSTGLQNNFQLPGLQNSVQGPGRAFHFGLPYPAPQYAFHSLEPQPGMPPATGEPQALPINHAPFPSIDPHPVPPGDPPFTTILQRVPTTQLPPVAMPFKQDPHTPSKKNLLKTPAKTTRQTPTKTPGKRKREEVEDSPSKKPTRVSNRTRTPKKHFEIE